MIHFDKNKPYNPIKYWEPSNKLLKWGIKLLLILILPFVVICSLCVLCFVAIRSLFNSLHKTYNNDNLQRTAGTVIVSSNTGKSK